MPDLFVKGNDNGSPMNGWWHENGKLVIDYNENNEDSKQYILKKDPEEEKKEEKKVELDSVDQTLMPTVEDLWKNYDTDGNGYLDKNETKAFVRETLGAAGMSSNDFTQEQFDEVWVTIDTDKSGRIEKPEMLKFLR